MHMTRNRFRLIVKVALLPSGSTGLDLLLFHSGTWIQNYLQEGGPDGSEPRVPCHVPDRQGVLGSWESGHSHIPVTRRNIKGRPFRVGLIVRINAYREEHPYE
jgi:hypothetical protein